MSLLVSALDASGDAHAAAWLEALRGLRPGIRAFGAGGVALEKAGAELRVSQRELAVAGLVEVLRIVPNVLRAWSRLERAAREDHASLAVLVDAPDFHLPLARRLRRAGVPVLFYIGPNVRRWRRGRIRQMARHVDRLATIFPDEVALYAPTALRVDYVGHPLVAPMRSAASRWTRAGARAALDLDPTAPTVVLAPGSRANELRHMLPLHLATAQVLRGRHPDVRFVLPVAPTVSPDEIARTVRNAGAPPIRVAADCTPEALIAADALLAKPGTITLEAALLDCPLVVAGRAHPLTAALMRRMIHDPRFALPNVIADASIVPEFLQQDARPEALAAALSPLLADGPARQAQRAGLARVRERLGDAEASERTARIADEMLREAEARRGGGRR